jgi:hypothetical protein
VLQITDAVDIVVYAPDDGWWYYPKHVEQFPDKMNCVTLNLVGYILEYKDLLYLLEPEDERPSQSALGKIPEHKHRFESQKYCICLLNFIHFS